MSSGYISAARDRFKTTLADCASFRTLVSAANRAEALVHIYDSALPVATAGYGYENSRAEMEALRPYARIWIAPSQGYSIKAIATSGSLRSWRDKGEVWCELEYDIAAGDTADDSAVQCDGEDLFGSIIQDLLLLIGGADYLNITEIELVGGPDRVLMNEREGYGDAQGGLLRIAWET